MAHAAVAGLLYLTGRRLWDGRTGFWAAAGYTAAPGVTVSAMIMSTDPVMMAFWAAALYAWVRAAERGRPLVGRCWGSRSASRCWQSTRLSPSPPGALGYGLFSARGRDWRGAMVAGLVALAVLSPNLWWQAQHGFVTVGHVAEDAAPPGERYTVAGLAEFLGTQLGVIGPVWFIAILAALWRRRDWLPDGGCGCSPGRPFRCSAPWRRSPSMSGRSRTGRRRPMSRARCSPRASCWRAAGGGRCRCRRAIGVIAAALFYIAAWAYAAFPLDLPRAADPFKKMRIGEPFCEAALGQMAEEGAEVLLSNDRRRLSECMFYGGLTLDDIAVWNPGLVPHNHHELVSTLRRGDDRPMLLAVMSPSAARTIAGHFEHAHRIETGTFQTHSGSQFAYSIWFVQGFRGY